MQPEESRSGVIGPPEWKRRWIAWRNRLMASRGFQSWASRIWPASLIARRRAAGLFDLVAGFTYSQVLLACVEGRLLDVLAEGPCDAVAVASHCGLSVEAAERLVRAAAALDLAEEVSPGWWMLGQQGAALHANPGAQAMIRHHKLLYADLADPLALLRKDRREETELSRFWDYREDAELGEVAPYSLLMAISQAMVAEQAIAAYPFHRHRKLLDVGGGHGVFAGALVKACPALEIGVFDLPPVLESAQFSGAITRHMGDFFHTPLPTGYDCITLVRILHDHDDEAALKILTCVRDSLAPDGRLVIAEPLAGTQGAEAMGDAYFGLYLWAMNRGRPRTASEYGALLRSAGFSNWRCVETRQTVIANLLVASY